MTSENESIKNSATEVEASEKKAKKPAARAPRNNRKQEGSTTAPDFEERVVAVNRVAKVVKGGRRFSFSALVVIGDMKGKVGYGLGKAKEVPDAIRKASQEATRRMIQVPIENGTIPHEIMGEFDAGKILFKPASDGTGVKAAGACRSILELAGIKNVLTKSLRGSNPHNIVKATFQALKRVRSVEEIANARGVNPSKLRMSSK